MHRHFLGDLVAVGVMTALMLLACPSHPIAVIVVVVLAWVGLQLMGAYSFMRALYQGDIVEYQGEPRRYAVAPQGRASWRARRFMESYLRVAAPKLLTLPPSLKDLS
jgi:hypothetical protein